MKIAFVLGTRPEIIRLSPMIRYIEKFGDSLGIEYFVIHAGQHYDYEMDGIFFKDLNLSKPKYNIGVGSGTHGYHMSKMIIRIEKILKDETPDMTIVYGDTNSGLGGTLASSKLKIPVIHLEAGCRAFDRNIPEELNRICMDHISRFLFPPDKVALQHLNNEGISKSKIYYYGNPLVDACLENYKISKKRSDVMKKININGDYAILTMHRAGNVDIKDRFERILNVLNEIDIPIVFPIHPRTKKRIEEFGLEKLLNKFVITEPLGYLDFLKLLGNSKVVFTDSGGVQVESNILGKPCIVLRHTTEWTLEMENMSTLVSDNRKLILDAYNNLKTLENKPDYSEHRGSAKKTIDKLLELYKNDQMKMWSETQF